MCGISGIFCYREEAKRPSDESALAMVDELTHRGPDDGGLWIDEPIWLGHRRLSILDPRPDGHQPMLDETRRYCISFNGEIYNYRELRLELSSLGHRFRTQTDTEVLVEGYRRWGVDLLQRLNGMFALAIWDREKRQLMLARDHAESSLFFTSTMDLDFYLHRRSNRS